MARVTRRSSCPVSDDQNHPEPAQPCYASLSKPFLFDLTPQPNPKPISTPHRSDSFNEFAILLMGQHAYDVIFGNNCPTCASTGFLTQVIEFSAVPIVTPAGETLISSLSVRSLSRIGFMVRVRVRVSRGVR